jgi:hypothetical protein
MFTESQGMLLGNGTTNASPRQDNNAGNPGSDVFYTVRREADSEATLEHVTLRHISTEQLKD